MSGTVKRFIILALVVLAVAPVAAQADGESLEFYESNIEINSSKTEFFVGMIFDEPPRGSFEYPLFYRIENFDDDGNIVGRSCEAQRKSWGTNIVCDFSRVDGDGRTLELKYETSDLVEIVEGQRLFKTDVRAPRDTDRMVVRTFLAEGFVLVEEGGVLPPFTPRNATRGSDGRRIFMVWDEDDLQEGEVFDVAVAYERALPESARGEPVMLVLGSVGLVLLLIVIALYKRRQEEEEVAAAPLKVLKKDERSIVEFLQERGAPAKQRDIVRHTGFSKAKVSRMVRDLRDRGILKIKPVGRTNEVSVVDELKDAESVE